MKRYSDTTYDHEGQDDLTGSPTLDRRFRVTFFPNARGQKKTDKLMSLRQMEAEIKAIAADRKEDLPWIKMAVFGKKRTPLRRKSDGTMTGRSLRHDANVQAVSGVEVDLDNCPFNPLQVRHRLRKAGLLHLLSTSPSHGLPGKGNRMRAFFPFSEERGPGERERMVARVNGLLGAALDDACFNLSQSFFFGGITGRPTVKTWLSDGRYLDTASDLDANAKGRHGRAKADKAESTGEKTGRPFDVIRDALFTIPNDGSVPDNADRTWWLDIGMALHHETDGSADGFAAFDEWSARHDSYDASATVAAWDSFGRTTGPMLTARFILNLARDHGWFDPRFAEMFDDEAEIDDAIDELVGDPANAKAKTKGKSRLTFLSPEDCATAENPAYVIKGLLYEGDIGCIYGQPNHGKSIIAPYLAYRVSQGQSAFGMRVRQGKTFYVAAEGAGGMRKRVTALRRRYGDAPGFHLVVGVSNLMPKKNGPSQDHKDLLEAVKRERPAVIIIDTIARAFAGLEENSSEGMGNVIHVAQSLTQWGAAVILIHHPTKSGEHLRGFGGLHGALDMELLVEKDADIITATAVKARDFADGGKLVFGKSVEVLGQDEDGDDITTVVCVERDDAPERKDRMTPSAKAAYETFHGLLDGRDAVPEGEWREACVGDRKVSAADNVDSRKKTFKRAVEELTRMGKVIFDGGDYRLPDHGRESFGGLD